MCKIHITTVLGVRRARSDERVVSRRCQPNPPGVKRRRNFERSLDPQPFSAATFSSSSQQFSAALLSCSFQQLFSAAILSSHSQQLFSAALSSHSQQLFSAAVLSSHYQQIFSANSLSSHFQQPLSAAALSSHSQLSSCFGQGLVVSYCHQRLSSCCCGEGLVVSYYLIMLLWSGVGGQLFDHHLTVVSCWGSIEDTF